MSDSDNQTGFEFNDDLDQLLANLPELTDDRTKAAASYKEHLWALVCIIERRLQQQGLEGKKAYDTSCAIIAEIATYQGGECRYLPRGDKLKQELRNIHMFKLWHLKSWTVEKVHHQYCPELNQIQVYQILRTKRQEHLERIQPKLI